MFYCFTLILLIIEGDRESENENEAGDKNEEQKAYEHISAEIESVDLPLGNTLRFLKNNTIYFDQVIWL